MTAPRVRLALAAVLAFMESITDADVRQIVSAVVARAKDGDLTAARLILDRVCGSQAVADWPSSAVVEQAAVMDGMLEGFARFDGSRLDRTDSSAHQPASSWAESPPSPHRAEP